MSDEKFGKYTLLEKLATGGMAEIWRAEQRGPGGFNKELVIKKILPHLAGERDMTQMFVDEARVVAQLTHPHIGQVFELGEHDGDYFIAMEFIDGLDLSELRDRVGRRGQSLPVAYGARIVVDVLRALDYAHEFTGRDGTRYEVVHRDISPQNILVSNEGIVKLVDFGVAKTEINRHETETGAVKGKFAYMAPEQIEDEQLDRRVDIFALGAVFYELLTGRKPFGDELKAVSRITSGEVEDPRTHRPGIPDRIAEIVMRALQRDRDRRFSTAAEMQRAVESHLQEAGELVADRQLSQLVRDLRGMEEPGTTDQLFGEDAQGVDRSSPRVTRKRSPEEGGEGSPEKRADAQDVATGTGRADRGSRKGLVVGLAAAGAVLLTVAVSGVVGLAWQLQGDDSGVGEASAQGEEVTSWRHGEDVRIVYIDAEEGGETPLYRGDQKIGTTPFHTLVRPGDYELQWGEDERVSTVVSVDEERVVQRFRVGE